MPVIFKHSYKPVKPRRSSVIIPVPRSQLLWLINWAISGIHADYYAGNPAYFEEGEALIKSLKHAKQLIKKQKAGTQFAMPSLK